MGFRFADEEWYDCVLEEKKPCSKCGMNDGDLHPFTKEAVTVSIYVNGDMLSWKNLSFLVVCDQCIELSYEDAVIQGVLI